MMTTDADPVPSPCVNLCRMDRQRRWCEGCLRTIDEIAGWSRMDESSKRAVHVLLPERREQRAAEGPRTD